MDAETRLRTAYALLVPAPVVFSIRAAFQMAGSDLHWAFLAMVGVLSGAGMLLALAALWKTDERTRALAAVAIALLGHYVVNRFIDPDLGGAMVYLGTGFLASLRIKWAQYAALVAGVGALFRGEVPMAVSHPVLIIGALAIAAALVLAAKGPAPQD